MREGKHILDIKENSIIIEWWRMENLETWSNIYPDICRESLGKRIQLENPDENQREISDTERMAMKVG